MEPLKIWLVVAEGPNEGDIIPVRQPRFLIGRKPGCHFRPSGEGIADLHSEIVARDGGFFLRSLHQTSLAGQQSARPIELHDGDRFHVGPWYLQVRIGSRPPQQIRQNVPKETGRKKVIVVGRKDPSKAATCQPPGETADQSARLSEPVSHRPHVSNRWIPTTVAASLLLVIVGIFCWTLFSSKPPSAVCPPSGGVAQNLPQPRFVEPRPPRRQAAAPDR